MLRSPLTGALVLLAALAAIAALLEQSPGWSRLQEVSWARSVPGAAVGSTRFARALRSLELLHPIPRGRRPDAPAASLGPIPPRRGSTPDQLMLGRPRGRHLLNSYLVDDEELAERAPVISVMLPKAQLDRMQRRSRVRGRKSERACFVGFFERGELSLATGAGIRIHGGSSRDRRSRLGYRLTARRSYGQTIFAPAPFPDDPEPSVKRLVLRPNRGRDHHRHMWHFSSPLAMDIARRIGVPAPRSRPVALYLNGDYHGVYELSDYLGPDYVRARFGIEQMLLARTKRNAYEDDRSKVKVGPQEVYDEFESWAHELGPDDSPQRIGERVDLENLYAWFMAVTFLDTRDAFQGSLVRDIDDPRGRWFWIAWDMEISFGVNRRRQATVWHWESLGGMLRNRLAKPRLWLFRRLMRNPAQRRRFTAQAVEALNHRIDAAFLAERLAFYRQQAELFAIADRAFLDELEVYLRHRPGAYRQDLGKTMQAGPSHRVRVSGPPGSLLEIDGYPTELPWQGEYFEGMTLRLAAPAGARLSIDGEPAAGGGQPIEIEVRADREIRLLAGA